MKDPRFNSMSAIKDPMLLEPVTRSAVANVIRTAETMYRLDLRIGETYRSVARQQELYLRGATTLSTVGVHHYGLACDLWIYIAGIPSWKADYSALRALSIIAKIVWGLPRDVAIRGAFVTGALLFLAVATLGFWRASPSCGYCN